MKTPTHLPRPVATPSPPREGSQGAHEDPAHGKDGPSEPTHEPAPRSEETTDPDDPTQEILLPRPKRSQLSALEIRALQKELQPLVGAFVEKAYQPTRDELLLRLRQPGVGRRDLYARRGALVLLTTNPPANPTHPSSFAMAIRRHAAGGRIYKIEQAGFDRIVTVHVQKRDGDYRIVLEMFGDGNCLLIRPDGRILLPLVHEAWKTRTLRPGAAYEPPPARADPFTFDEETFIAKLREGNREIVRAVAREVGLGGPVAEEVIARAGVDKNAPIEEAHDETLARIFAAWEGLRQEVSDETPTGRLLMEDGRAVDCAPHRSVLMEQKVEADSGRYQIVETPTFSAALDRLHLEGRRTVEAKEESERVDEAKTKLETQRDAQEEAIVKFAEQEKKSRRHGDLLYAHYQEIERILEGIHTARREHDWATIMDRIEQGRKAGNPDAQRIVSLEPKKGRLVLRLDHSDGSQEDVALDITKNVNENAEVAYTRSKAGRSKLAGAKKALASTRERLQAAAQEASMAAEEARELAARPALLIGGERHHWFESFRWMYASNGELVLGGRDAASNDRLIKKHLQENDRYVHADIHGAPSIVVKALREDEAIPEKTLEEAGRFAVIYSRAFPQAGSADAYWATPMQVSKTAEAGEHLARGAFIVRGKRTWMRKLPMELAMGRVWLDKQGHPTAAPTDPTAPGGLRAKIMAGAPSAIQAHADRWVVLGPGKTDRRRVTKTLARAFDAHPDPIERNLPPGSLQLVSAHGLHVQEEAFEEAS